jgi:hypothetical protein
VTVRLAGPRGDPYNNYRVLGDSGLTLLRPCCGFRALTKRLYRTTHRSGLIARPKEERCPDSLSDSFGLISSRARQAGEYPCALRTQARLPASPLLTGGGPSEKVTQNTRHFFRLSRKARAPCPLSDPRDREAERRKSMSEEITNRRSLTEGNGARPADGQGATGSAQGR